MLNFQTHLIVVGMTTVHHLVTAAYIIVVFVRGPGDNRYLRSAN